MSMKIFIRKNGSRFRVHVMKRGKEHEGKKSAREKNLLDVKCGSGEKDE